ncbi:threonine dehydratase [Pararhodobacter sp. CCB-MM2]|uniref:threonine dehydratase n=1 Tax=Pararhodobacter sp. CCB-MM2 TaxID=1786003 RepID=UPI000833739A|nr:threonine dehydratase [Pararhodobacter sp. CCB-MM2]
MFTEHELDTAHSLVSKLVPPTPALDWPLLAEALGARQVIVKHENHAPTGAFKVRGGVTFMDWLKREHPDMEGVITATRGNHGQSQARAATALGLKAKIYVPKGNSVEKNAAMRAYGADLVEYGNDFDEAKDEAMRIAATLPLFPVPPFHRELVRGVATYGLELFRAHPDLERVYVPIGCGSGICGTIAARDALGLKCEVVGVVSTGADGALRSVAEGMPIATDSARTFADGMAVRVPVAEALAIYGAGAHHLGAVPDEAIAEAIRLYFTATHNLAEGAGAAALALAMAEREELKGRKVGLILSGGNIDRAWYAEILNGRTPEV